MNGVLSFGRELWGATRETGRGLKLAFRFVSFTAKMDGALVSGEIKGVLTFGRVFRRANRENGRGSTFGFQSSYLPAKDLDGLQRFLGIGHDVMLRKDTDG